MGQAGEERKIRENKRKAEATAGLIHPLLSYSLSFTFIAVAVDEYQPDGYAFLSFFLHVDTLDTAEQ